MQEVLSQIDLEWLLGLLVACGVYYFKRLHVKEEQERMQMKQEIFELNEKHFNIERALNLVQSKEGANIERISNVQEKFSFLYKDHEANIDKLEVKMYKIRGEIMRSWEVAKKEQNAILAKLDSKIQNIYIF